MTNPDFEQIVLDTVIRGEEIDGETMAAITEALRQVWNARGAADVAILKEALDGDTASPPWIALKALDR